MKRFENKVCVITGASNGIGRQMAHDFAQEGANVFNLDIVEPQGQLGHVIFIKCDLRDEKQIQDSVDSIIKASTKIDYLINNACYSNNGILSGCSAEAFNDVLKVGVTAPYLLTKGFMNHFAEGASIINIASTRAFMSQMDTESYSAAKGGISALTHAMSLSLAGKVRVNAISPGWIDTTAGRFDTADHVQHPAGRIGTTSDISKLAMFLCSEDASFMTGENVVVDGGMTRKMIYHGEEGWKLER